MKQDFLAELSHSWGKSPEQKKRESEYNAEYYKKHKEKWQNNRPKAREKYVTTGGAGVEKGDSVDPGAARKEELARTQYLLEERQRVLNNMVWTYEVATKDVMNDVKATKMSALINFRNGKFFKAAKDFLDARSMQKTVKKAEKNYKPYKKAVRSARVSNQHAIDEIARMNKNRTPKEILQATPSFIPFK